MKRAILNEVLSGKPDVPLYHYTRQSGLLGIIGKTEIWATHTQYLNDRREYLHALDLVHEEIDTLLSTADQEGRSILGDMKNGLSGIEGINVCVCSFSEERDSLSQWRAYAAGSSGFAIGFPGDFLAEIAKRENWYLARCIYEPAQQQLLIRALVAEVFEENVHRRNTNAAGEDPLPLGGSLCAYLHRYAPILKHPCFHEEREWRIISRPLMCGSARFDFREGSSVLIPYYKLPLIDQEQPLRVREVVVGPTPNQQQSTASVRGLLVRHGLGKVPVELSKVPYRNW